MSAAVPFAWHASRVRAAGCELAVLEAGPRDAPAVLLLHGLGHWADAAWSGVAPYLASSRRVIAFDLPGFGESDKPRARYDGALFRDVTRALAAALGLERFALAGHSLGGYVAAEVAGAVPHAVTHLALIAPAGFGRSARHAGFALLARAFGERIASRAPSPRVVRAVLTGAVHDPASVHAAHFERACALARDTAVRRAFTGVYAAAADALPDRAERLQRFARYDGPVLCAWGAHDRYVPIAAMRVVRETYPQATVLVLERSAHLPMIEQPAELGPALANFLSRAR